jgi:probable rRNA maturation factor
LIEIEVDNRSGVTVDEAGAAEVARRVLAAEGVASGELGLVFVGPDESRALKKEHLGVDEATDALAFPIDGLAALPDGMPRQLGDVVVCPDVCALEASSAKPATPGGRPRAPSAPAGGAEWRGPLVHALLHLVGYDHGPEMEAREAVYAE